MKEDLKQLFESVVLNEESKTVLKEAFNQAIAEKTVELQESFDKKMADEVKQLSESAQEMVEEAVADHLEQFADEIAHARTLEVQYASKLEMFKESYAEKTEELVDSLVNESVAKEIDELKESIEEAKKIKFALDIFESYKQTFEKLFGGEETASALDELKEAKQELDTIKKTAKIASLVESLQGSKKKIATSILEGVDLDKIEEKFESIRPLLVSESANVKDEAIEESATVEDVKGTVVIEEDVAHEPVATEKTRLAALRIQKSLKAIR
ncbi:hypothetical protein [Alishewanella phage vB_AspM_Slickus01]|nr:hypothetical protein [Alishewanella phage vB_AspM_Slickus01]